ncbi:acyl dehydratase [Murinocardiopsis flavida]|uniref:Acyl dehydratase n=1 Tax=Murinocardiopsis flavida TaxID=645275 RepID=A0A2P8DGS0_9ACTN|nr:MaoC family dehydratase [Murinocardiopsis flavida]PSK96415.1 acyl dehydratase [Murinocardiopsis flavida]
MRTFSDATALAAAAGEHLGHSAWHSVTQDRIDRFAAATGDHQWIHVDAERAAQGPFGGTIAHGFLSLSMLPLFGAEVYTLETPPAMGINYGLDKVRFLQPVREGARVRDGVELVAAKETPKGLLFTMRHTVEIDGGERPALVADALVLLVP